MTIDTLSRLIEMDENIKLQPEEEGKEFRYFPFEELPPVTTQVVEEVIKCEIGNINIQHTDPIEINTDIHLPLKDDKLAKLQESDPHTRQLRKQWEKKNLDQNTYTLENNILKRKLVNNGLLYTPIVVPDILKDCLLILAHNKQGHNRFRRTYASLKNRYHWKGMKKSVYQHCTNCQVCAKHNIKTQQLKNKHFSSPPQPMEFIAMDLIGEFHPASSKCNRFALTTAAHEAAVKHTLLESENPKYLGTNEGMINMGLMTKMYNIVAHNLNEARKAKDGRKKGTTPKEPERLKIGDNILVRDHTSKVFQPKYKDFCIVGLLGKNQVGIKDNHGHITKVHRRDIKKIPMTEKVCKLYEEEQTGKSRDGRKAVPTSKMPDLAWDIAETQLIQEAQKENSPNMTPSLQIIVMVIILIVAIVKQTTTQIKKIAKKAVQVIENTTKETSHNKIIKNIKDFHRTTMPAITIVTNMTDRTNRSKQAQINNKTTRYFPGTQKLNDEYDKLYQSLTSRTCSYCDN